MRRAWGFGVLGAAVVALGGRALAAQGAPAAAEVIAAERAFARQGRAVPVRQAFLAAIADSGVVLGVGGRDVLAQGPEWPVRLEWGPAAVGVSAAGDLAWSTGPARRRPLAAEAPVVDGEFATIWARQPDGRWRFLLDVGVDHAPGDTALLAAVLAEQHAPAVMAAGATVRDADAARRARQALEDLEVATRRILAGGPGVLPIDREARLLRSGRLPIVGERAVRDSLTAWQAGGPLALTVLHQGVSRSHDLAWRAGRYAVGAGAAAERGLFLRVWRLDADARWRIVLEVRSPDPRVGTSPADARGG